MYYEVNRRFTVSFIWLTDILDYMSLAVITLLGVILIGLGLALQGWFILDMNKRFSKLLGKLLVAINEDD